MRSVQFAVLCAAGLLLSAGAASADTFVLTNSTHPDCHTEFGAAPSVDCSIFTANGGGGQAVDGSYFLVGADLNTEFIVPSFTRLTAIADADKVLTFDWDYITFDDIDSRFDPAGYFVNGTDTQLTTPFPRFEHLTGQVTFAVTQGQGYGFYVFSGDSTSGPGLINFSLVGQTGPGGGAVPEPSSWALMIAGFGLVGAALRSPLRRNRIA